MVQATSRFQIMQLSPFLRRSPSHLSARLLQPAGIRLETRLRRPRWMLLSTRQDGLESLAVTSLRARKNYKVSLAPQAPGFSLIEVLLSMFILTVALLGIAGALALQSGGVAGGITFGLAAINRSHLITTATALAQAM